MRSILKSTLSTVALGVLVFNLQAQDVGSAEAKKLEQCKKSCAMKEACKKDGVDKKSCTKECTKECCKKGEGTCPHKKGEVKQGCKSHSMQGEGHKCKSHGDATSAEKGAANVASVQSTCPVMGGKINKEIYADYNGKRVYFCCKGCIEPFNKEPQKYLDKLKSLGENVETVSANVQ